MSFQTSLIAAAALALSGSGCAVIGIANALEQHRQHEALVAKAQADAAAAQREGARQVKIAEARTQYLQSQLDAQVYRGSCGQLAAAVQKVVIKLGTSIVEQTPELVVTAWSYVSAEYAQTSDYRIRKTRKSSQSRYVVDLKPVSGGCRVSAEFQYRDEAGVTGSERALDLESRVMREVEPARYAEVEKHYLDIEATFPPVN
jgi:hypothetical protein